MPARAGRTASDDGAVAVIAAVLVVVLVGMAAFVADFGLAYSSKRQLQNAADGAALAAAKQLYDVADPGRSCAVVLASARANARSVAVAYEDLNAPRGSALKTGAAPAGWVGDAGVAFRCNPAGNAEVMVSNTNLSPTLFGGVFGATGYQLAQTATAAMGPPNSLVGLRPFAVCAQIKDALLAQDALTPGAAQLITLNKVFNASSPTGAAPCGSAPGNWGTLDFNGGSNQPADITLWTDVGYNAPVDLGSDLVITFPGDPGFPAANSGQCTTADGCRHTVKLDGALDDILGRPSVLPIFDVVTGSGQNATYQVVGFLGVVVCGWKVGKASGTTPDPTFGGAACYDSSPTVALPTGNGSNDNAFQVRVKRFIPIGDIGAYCGLTSDPTVECKTNLRVTQLIN